MSKKNDVPIRFKQCSVNPNLLEDPTHRLVKLVAIERRAYETN